MQAVSLYAATPYNIGDKIIVDREIHPSGLIFRVHDAERTITDIVCHHSVKTGETLFLYELDGRGPLVQIREPRRKKIQRKAANWI